MPWNWTLQQNRAMKLLWIIKQRQIYKCVVELSDSLEYFLKVWAIVLFFFRYRRHILFPGRKQPAQESNQVPMFAFSEYAPECLQDLNLFQCPSGDGWFYTNMVIARLWFQFRDNILELNRNVCNQTIQSNDGDWTPQLLSFQTTSSCHYIFHPQLFLCP